MNIFKRILECLFKKKSSAETLKLQQKREVKIDDKYNEYEGKFFQNLKLQVISRKKDIEITERVGDGFGFKKNISS